jgi:hypothetical protein
MTNRRKERSTNLFGTRAGAACLAGTMAVLTLLASPALAGWGPATPNFNLEAVLRPAAGGPDKGFGLVKFRQPKDEDKIVYLDTWVRDLEPNHGYFLERATDPVVDDFCEGTNWLRLGQGAATTPITTDDRGTGRADLFRNLGTIPTGMEFDIHFRIVDAADSTIVLESGCYQFVVSQ